MEYYELRGKDISDLESNTMNLLVTMIYSEIESKDICVLFSKKITHIFSRTGEVL